MHRPSMRATSGPARRAVVALGIVPLVLACAATRSGPPPTEVIATFTLTSAAFSEGGSIPRQHTCDGADTSPALAWSGAPARTRAMALIVDDPDAGGFVHWVLFNVAGAASGSLPGGITAAFGAAPQGRNDFGRIGYGGPCPPSGTHRYVFRLLALDAALPAAVAPRAADILSAARGHVLAEARLTGTYRRGG